MAKLTASQLGELKERFFYFCDFFEVRNREELWAEILENYESDKRHYHNLHHIYTMLGDYNEFCIKMRSQNNGFTLAKRGELEAAIWLHDLIYRTDDGQGNVPNDSEVLSATRMRTMLAGSNLDLNVVKHMIILTRHSQSLTPKTLEEELLLDLDLAVLGKPRPIFDDYEEGIRREYIKVPEAHYRHIRAGVMEKLRDRLHTPFFKEKYGEAANRNIDYSIARLLDNSIPLLPEAAVSKG